VAIVLARPPSTVVGAFLTAGHDPALDAAATRDPNAGIAPIRALLLAALYRVMPVVAPTALAVAVVPDVRMVSYTSEVPLHLAVALPKI
jgi:hypothetical protein